jgi:catechol 2,3-dioxygenase-like lactoylglutathione lyase family enzyme
MQLNYVRLLVNDFTACFRFYRDVLGMTVTWGEEGSGYADFAVDDSFSLALFDRSDMAQALGTAHLPANAEAQDRVALIFGVEDVEAATQALTRQGVSFVTPPTDHPDWGIRTAHFRDPDGNLIEIFNPLPQAE